MPDAKGHIYGHWSFSLLPWLTYAPTPRPPLFYWRGFSLFTIFDAGVIARHDATAADAAFAFRCQMLPPFVRRCRCRRFALPLSPPPLMMLMPAAAAFTAVSDIIDFRCRQTYATAAAADAISIATMLLPCCFHCCLLLAGYYAYDVYFAAICRAIMLMIFTPC